ncbi:hypothetical protein MCOR02_002796 [Pyricularia oryzae]|nr:hypothetical protein MCOR02_002796 [Pyricularia oryzae]
MPASLQPPILTDSTEELIEHLQGHPEQWVSYISDSYQKLQLLHDSNVRLNSCLEMQEAETQRARAETDRVRDKAQADILAMAMEKASAITSRDAAFAELEKTRSELKEVRTVTLPTAHITTPAPITNTPAEPFMVTPMGTTPPPVSEHPASARLSERLPDPDKFTGARSDLRRFATQIRGKMTSNIDRFPNPESRLIYIAGRLSGKAYNLILPKMVGGTPQFGDYTDLLQYLEEAFGDPDYVQNAQNKLYALKQRNVDFAEYLSEFQRLSLEGEMPEDALPPLLFQGISEELQDMLLHNPAPSRQYHEFTRHLQSLDNRYRQHQQYKNRQTRTPRAAAPPARAAPRTQPDIPRAAPKPNAELPLNDPMDLSNQRRHNRKENMLCYRCGSQEHFVAKCPEPDTRRTRLHQAGIERSRSRSMSPRQIQTKLPKNPRRGSDASRSSSRSSKNGARLG